ncbi:MAG: cell division protein ZapA [Tannerella sp.]|nr:cell division protein ZapA [Tannerella sp.]
MKREELIISVNVADTTIKIIVGRGDERTEATIRKAAKRLESLIAKYKQMFVKTLSGTELLTMAAIQAATDFERLLELYDPTTALQHIQTLSDELDACIPISGE